MPNRINNRFINASLKYNGSTDDTTIAGTWGGATWVSMTWTCWVRFSSLNTGDQAAIISSTSTNFMHLQTAVLAGTGSIAIYHNAGTALLTGIPQRQIYGGWHHIAVTAKSGEQRLYIDGVLFSSDNDTFANITTATALRFGEGFSGGRNMPGLLTSVACYKAADTTGALSQAQVLQDMTAGPSTNVSSTLYGYWPHTNGTGATLTDTVTGNNGTITGATWNLDTPSCARPLVKPRGSGSVFFNGTTQYGQTPSVTFGINQMTVAMWVKPQGVSGVLMESSVDFNSRDAFIIAGLSGANKFHGSVHNAGIGYSANNSSPVGAFQDWHRVVLVWDGTLSSAESKFYIDGRLAQETTLDANLTASLANNALYFAARGGVSSFYRGYIGASLIHASKLWTATEVFSDYIHDTQPSATVLGKWDFTDGAGATVTDSSGNGYHITLSNSPTWSTDVPLKARTAA